MHTCPNDKQTYFMLITQCLGLYHLSVIKELKTLSSKNFQQQDFCNYLYLVYIIQGFNFAIKIIIHSKMHYKYNQDVNRKGVKKITIQILSLLVEMNKEVFGKFMTNSKVL